MKQTVIPIQRVIQNVDRIVKPSELDNSPLLYVTGAPFLTIQGEGPEAGKPAWFVRLAGCNFGDKTTAEKSPGMCAFCDTNFKLSEATEYDPSFLLRSIIEDERFDASQILVITGGEPTLQVQTLLRFMNVAAPFFSRIQIETNGTQARFFRQAENTAFGLREMLDKTTIVVSPKASELTGTYTPTSETVLRNVFDSTALKFLISADDPLYNKVPQWAQVFAREHRIPLYVSPIAVYKKPYQGEISSAWDHDLIDPVATAKNYGYAAQYAIENGLRLSIQQHLFCAIA